MTWEPSTSVSTKTIVEQAFREIRAFRIYNRPTEVHKWSTGQEDQARLESRAALNCNANANQILWNWANAWLQQSG
jgi:hypothetical protein